MNWFDRFCARFDGPAEKISRWWNGPPEGSETTSSSNGMSALEARNARLYIEAARIRNRHEQAPEMRKHARAMASGDKEALVKELLTCIETTFESALQLKKDIKTGIIDPFLLLNAVEGKSLKAKSVEPIHKIEATLYGMRLAVSFEAHLGMLYAFQDEKPESGSIREQDLITLKQGLLRSMLKMKEEFGEFNLLKATLNEIRNIVGELPEEKTRASRGNTSSNSGSFALRKGP